MEDDVDGPDGVNLDGDVDMERDGDDEVEEDELEEVEEEEDEDDGKAPRTIVQGEMAHTSTDEVDTMVDNQAIMLPWQGHKMREHTPRQQPGAPAPQPLTPEPRPRQRTPESHPFSGLDHLGRVRPQKPRPAVPTWREAEESGNTSDEDVNLQLLIESAGGDSLPDVPLPNVPLPEARLDIGEKDFTRRLTLREAVMSTLTLDGRGRWAVRDIPRMDRTAPRPSVPSLVHNNDMTAGDLLETVTLTCPAVIHRPRPTSGGKGMNLDDIENSPESVR
jgi:hypothetical protein